MLELRMCFVGALLTVMTGCPSQTAAPPVPPPLTTLAQTEPDTPQASVLTEPPEDPSPEAIPEIPVEVRHGLETLGARITLRDNGYSIDIRDSTRFTDESIDLVLQCPAVVDLTMQHVAITDEGLKNLRGLPQLSRLILNESPISSAGIRTLSMLPLRKGLISLGLRGTKLSNDEIALIKDFPRLQRLDVSQTSLSDACLPDLQSLSLLVLNIESTQISAAAIEQLQAKHPQMVIKK